MFIDFYVLSSCSGNMSEIMLGDMFGEYAKNAKCRARERLKCQTRFAYCHLARYNLMDDG